MSDGNLKLLDIIKIVDAAYGDGEVMRYHAEPDGWHGDGLARFIECEIRETYEDDDSDGGKLRNAERVMQTAVEEISAVCVALAKVRAN